jgi:HK97 gp10 family phage protein
MIALSLLQPRDVADRLRVRAHAAAVLAQVQFSAGLAENMKARAPRDSGALAESIAPMADGVRIAAPQARYVEYGTRHTPAQPFIAPAIAAFRADRRVA